MQATTLFWHIINFLAPAVVLGGLAAAGGWLAWRRSPRRGGFIGLWVWTSAAALLASALGLAWFAQDGKMLTYALMVLAGAATLVWRAAPRPV